MCVNHTKLGEWVYDPFLGSGTTLVGAEWTWRVCCGLELDPKYVDVIVGRREKMTGHEATLEGSGATFAQVHSERRQSAVEARLEDRENSAGRPLSTHGDADGNPEGAQLSMEELAAASQYCI